MGLINREKRLHARPARTVTPPSLACAGVRAPRCSLVRCPSHFPKVAALGPEASDSAPPRPEQRACILGRQQGWRFNSGAPPAHVFSHLTPPASSALPVLSLVDQLRPPNCRFTSAKVSNLRAPRSPNRQVGGRSLRRFRGRPRIRRRATLPRAPPPSLLDVLTQPPADLRRLLALHSGARLRFCSSCLSPLGRRPSRFPALHHASRFTRQGSRNVPSSIAPACLPLPAFQLPPPAFGCLSSVTSSAPSSVG